MLSNRKKVHPRQRLSRFLTITCQVSDLGSNNATFLGPRFDGKISFYKNRQIKTRIGRIKAASGSKVTLEDGSTIADVDTIIFCTGFRPIFPFFPPEILEAISFDPNDSFCPFLLHKATFCANLPGLAFVGVYRGPYFLIVELQSKWVAEVFSRKKTITPAKLKKGELVEKQIRDQRPRPQFPHSDYVGFACDLAEEIGILPSSSFTENHPLFMPVDFSPENISSFHRMNAEREKFLSGKMVAGAVFRALAGKHIKCHVLLAHTFRNTRYKIHRKLDSKQ